MRIRLIRSLLKLLSFLSLRVSHWLGALAGLALYLLPNRIKRITDANLAICYPANGEAWRGRVARISLMETGKSVAEAPYLWRATPAQIAALAARVSGQAFMDEAVAQGRETVMRAGRENTGANLAPTDARGIKALIRALNRGQCVGILPDQVPNMGNRVYAPFFDMDAYTMLLITRLAGKRRIPVVFMYAQRLRGGAGFHVHYVAAPAKIYDPDPVIAAAAVNRGVEGLMRECPEQYAWSYKRFKDRPSGAQSVY